MPRISTSDRVKKRIVHLLKKMLDYANQGSEYSDRFLDRISVRWLDDTAGRPKLVIRSKLRSLLALVFPDQPEQFTKEHLRHDLRVLKDFLGILEDNRTKTQGAENWHFTLKLWYRSTERNLKAFEHEWTRLKSQKTKSVVVKDTSLPSSNFHRSSKMKDEISESEATSTETTPLQARPQHNLPNRYYTAFIGSKALISRLLELLSPLSQY